MSQFKEYVTSTAFRLSLSKPQIECLSQIDQLGTSWMFITTFNALASKGLVEREAKEEFSEHGGKVRLTEAGKLVIPLLKMAGLYMVMPTWPDPEPQPDIQVVIRNRKTGEVIE